MLIQVLKVAQQHKLLKTLKPVQTECYCCHYHSTRSDCTTCSCCQHWPTDQCGTTYQTEESKSNCRGHLCALQECKKETDSDSHSCPAQLCKRETCTIIQPKRVHCHSCQSLSSTNVINSVCPFASTSPSPPVLGLCSLSVCCKQHNTLPCPCHLMCSSLTEVETEADVSTLKKQSPTSPPPSPDLKRQTDETQTGFLHQIKHEETEPVQKIRGSANLKTYSVKDKKHRTMQSSQTNKNEGSFQKDVVGCFGEKLKTIKTKEMDESGVPETGKQKVHCEDLKADAHLTEIITTVLHTGSSSKYNLGEIINYHKNKQPQSPNTRYRRRQEMLTTMTTPTEDATPQGETFNIKHELARTDLSQDKETKPMLKSGANKSNAGRVVNQVHGKTQNEDMVSIKEESDVFKETHSSLQDDNWVVANGKTKRKPDKQYGIEYANNLQCPLNQSKNLRKARKSQRNIVPPPRFSSYVTEPRKMYFVACFSDTIFNQRSQTNEVFTSPQSPDNMPNPDNNAFQSTKEGSQGPAIPISKTNRSTKSKSDTVTESRNVPRCRRNLQLDSETIPSTCTDDPCLEYTSPIKLMFVSPVKNEEGMKYSLKSAATVNGSRADACFDPCIESSWSGTSEKISTQNTQLASVTSSPTKSSPSTAQPPPVSPRSSFTSPKSSPKSFPAKSCSPKSNSSPKAGSRRLGESTQTKWNALDDSQRCSHDSSGIYENTPQKRRRGRPKKLGPQLEKKVKRPIGRPRKEVIESRKKEIANGSTNATSDTDKNVNRNLKITVLYGRSRRNKRMVSEGFDKLQTEFCDACQAVGLDNNWKMLMKTTEVNSTDVKTAAVELSPKIPLIKPVKDCALQHKSSIKCPSADDAAAPRKPGRPAKVKISGISVTVTTVSPRQRKIQINKDKTSPVKQNHKRALFQKPLFAKEPKTIACHSISKSKEEQKEEGETEPNPPVAVRHSERIRKPSIHFLHAVATSSSYSRSSALVRRSKQLLLKTKKDESQNKLQPSGDKKIRGERKGKTSSLGLQEMASVSVDSIYHPKEVKWWSTSLEQETINQELARRIRLISDTWVSDSVRNDDKSRSQSSQKPKCSSVVRSMFDCCPNKPRSCSMQQLCSWFMQTTETQSLSIVKKASSRNPYEVMHFPRSTYKKTMCYSPQAERLRKHLKKFAKSVPKTPNDFAQAQKMIRRSIFFKPNFKYWFSKTFLTSGRLNYITTKRNKSFCKYKANLFRAKRRFLPRKEREIWLKNKTLSLNRHATRLHLEQKSLLKSTEKHYCFREPPMDPVEDPSCSNHSTPETMKECRVFLRKLSSPNDGASKEEMASHTVTLDEGSPSALLFRSEKVGKNQAVKSKYIRSSKRALFRDSESHSPGSFQGLHMEPKRGRSHRRISGSPQPPPAKRLRQSRMAGLSGPRWRDFVLEN